MTANELEDFESEVAEEDRTKQNAHNFFSEQRFSGTPHLVSAWTEQ